MDSSLPSLTETQGSVSASVRLTRAKRLLRGLRNYLFGVFFTLAPLGFIAVGWTYRFCQRNAFRYWWKRATRAGRGEHFADFAASHEALHPFVRLPRWFRSNRSDALSIEAENTTGRYRRFRLHAKRHLGSFRENVRIGIKGLLCTLTWTLPSGIAWAVAWYSGWDNSFNKGYEQAGVGPGLGLFGVALFIAAMFYVPMAQARQAVTGRWNGFFEFRLIRKLIRKRWFSCLCLAGLYSLLSLPLFVLTIARFGLGNSDWVADLSPGQQLGVLALLFTLTCLYLFPAFVILKAAATRAYASGLLECLQCGDLEADVLSPHEKEVFEKLNLLRQSSTTPRSLPLRFIIWTSSRTGRVVSGIAAFLLWFTFIAQIFVSQFFLYEPPRRWIVHPLIQMPHTAGIPAPLKAALKEAIPGQPTGEYLPE